MRGIECVTGNAGNHGETNLSLKWYKIPTVAVEATRAATIVPRMVVVQCTAGSNETVDGAVSADTTGTASRKILGIVGEIRDEKGRPLHNAIRTTTQGGFCTIVPARGNTFRALEDGVGGNISSSLYQTGFVSLAIGTATATSTDDTDTPNPEANILLDSSTTGSGTSSNRAIQLAGLDGEVGNALTTGVKALNFKFTDAFTEPID